MAFANGQSRSRQPEEPPLRPTHTLSIMSVPLSLCGLSGTTTSLQTVCRGKEFRRDKGLKPLTARSPAAADELLMTLAARLLTPPH